MCLTDSFSSLFFRTTQPTIVCRGSQEALRENDLSVSKICVPDDESTRTSGQRTDADCHSPSDSSNSRRNTSHADDDLNSSQKTGRRSRRCTNEQTPNSLTTKTTSASKNQTTTTTIADFADWLSGIEKQLDSICLCNNKPVVPENQDSTSTTDDGPTSLTDVEIVKVRIG